MRAEIVSIGTELLLGTITDTNAAYLAQRLSALGIDCYYISQVGDNLGRLTETLGRAWERSALVVATGGLGPTGDDLTREAIAALLGETMTVVPDLERDLRAFFARRGVEMPERNLKQATLIPSAQALHNAVGTAPGWWVSRNLADGPHMIVAMPGVPFEMKRMWEREAEPRLRAGGADVIVSKTLKILGVGESAVEEKVHDLMQGSNPTLAPYAKQDGVHLRITAKAPNVESAQRLITGLEAPVRERLGSAIYGADADTPQGVVWGLLQRRGLNLALLEIGPAAAGSLSSLLGGAQGGTPSRYLGCVSGESAAALGRLLRLAAGDDMQGEDLRGAAETVRRVTGADVVLAVSVGLTSADATGEVASVDAEIVLLMPEQGGGERQTRLRQSWKTATGEVRRLVGLAALNVLRLRLLKIEKQGEGG